MLTYFSLSPSTQLLGPNKNHSGISSNEHRQIISAAISSICSQERDCQNMKLVARAVSDLNAVSTSYVDEHDFERILPVMNGLGATSLSDEGSWHALSSINSEELQSRSFTSKTFDGTRMLLPLIYTCFHYLYDADGVISRAANKALKSLVSIASELTPSSSDNADEASHNPWVRLIETTFVSCLKTGLTTKEIATRRSFVLLVSHVARNFTGCKSVHLYGDLRCLSRDDDQDLDFFLNVTHVQLHRRARAFKRLRSLLTAHSASHDPLFSDQSLGNVLLPLAMHPVCESTDCIVISSIPAYY